MDTITNAPRHFRLYGAVLAMAALLIALLAVTMTAGPTMAQTDPNPNPPPCGPGQQDAPDNPAAIVSTGHYAVFDGYWDSGTKTLNLNLCPPSVEHEIVPGDLGGPGEEVSTRTASNVDIRRTVFHIHEHDFVHELTVEDVEKYDFFKLKDNNGDGMDDAVGQTVWWLKVDDPSTEGVDEDSALAMGFSAALFDSDYWYLDDGDEDRYDEGAKPLQYEFEVIREPGIPIAEQGHVFAFDDSEPASGDEKTAYWDSSEVDANALPLYPGEYHHLQWAFTKPGTYVISVQLKGHVRQANPHRPGDKEYDENWEPISDDNVETSEVVTYIFHVGPLTLDEQPMFQVERSVAENSAANTPVGPSVKVAGIAGDALDYTLAGDGSENFAVQAAADGAQIVVAPGAALDFETRPAYDLTLRVSDGKMITGAPDPATDSVIAVRVQLTDVDDDPSASLSVDTQTPRIGDTVTFTITVDNPTVPAEEIRYAAFEQHSRTGIWFSQSLSEPTWTVAHDGPGLWHYHARAHYTDSQGNFVSLQSNTVDVTWVDP